MHDFESLWNYNDPAGTEKLFQKALEEAADKEEGYRLELLTQIARTYSLRSQSDTAHEILDRVENQLGGKEDVVYVRLQLERGRSFNSAGDKIKAYGCFLEARSAAARLKEDFYEVDALHMMAIVTNGEASFQFNHEAISLCQKSEDERAKGWLGSLLNNQAWNYFDQGDFKRALSLFLSALEWREEKKQAQAIFLAKWCVARTLRALNRKEEAVKIQLGLLEEMLQKEAPDGYVYEELGELYLGDQPEMSRMYFGLAWQELSGDVYMQKHDAARLQRIKELGS